MNSQPNCPLCLSNNLFKDEVIAESAGGFASHALGNEDCLLLIPKAHIESLSDLPDDWWADFKALLAKLPVPETYNLSLNMGSVAGQTLKHLHFWIVPRAEGTPSAGKGLASLIKAVDGTGKAVE
jgi:diadenosine tetraphosphate (Ap4A) HIT family hydrolase